MTIAPAVAVAATFTWLGMVVAISFLEAPLKFRAPGVTRWIGVSIGRLVFRALNTVEVGLGLILVVVAVISDPPAAPLLAGICTVSVLAVQLLIVRPYLRRHSDAVLAGSDTGGRSNGRLLYVGLEILKVGALLATGATLFSAF